MNDTPIPDQFLTVSIIDENGNENDQSMKTNQKGDGNLQLNGLTPNNYTVNIYYDGNENFTNSNTTQTLKIIEEFVKSTSSSTTSQSTNTNNHQESNSYGPEIDSSGITREQAMEYGYTYTPEHGGHYIGSNDRWDENAGVYHD